MFTYTKILLISPQFFFFQVGHFNRTGKRHTGHFNTWLQDEIVEKAADAGVQPSFPIPDILPT